VSYFLARCLEPGHQGCIPLTILAQNMHPVRPIPRSVVINQWSYHSLLNHGLVIIFEDIQARTQRLGTWNPTAIVHRDRRFPDCGTLFWLPLPTHHRSRRNQHGHNRLCPGTSSETSILLVRIPAVLVHRTACIQLRNLTDRILRNTTAGSICQSVARQHAPGPPVSSYASHHVEGREAIDSRYERPRQTSTSSYMTAGAPSPYTSLTSEQAAHRNSNASYDRSGNPPFTPTGPEASKKYLGIKDFPGEGTFHVYDGGYRIPTSVDGETVNPQWGLTKANKPRKRLALACLDCREKKIKCEPGASSCLQCEKAKRPCRRYVSVSPCALFRPANCSQSTKPDAHD
jgi:hypothetical protein